MVPILAYAQHYKKYYSTQFAGAAAAYGLNQLEIDILLFLHNNPELCTASDICRYRGWPSPTFQRRWSACAAAACWRFCPHRTTAANAFSALPGRPAR